MAGQGPNTVRVSTTLCTYFGFKPSIIGFLIAAGVDYRLTEEPGFEPGPTPAGIAFGITAGFWGLILGLIILGAVGIRTMLRR